VARALVSAAPAPAGALSKPEFQAYFTGRKSDLCFD